MTKTIEEAAREYAKDRVGDYDYLGNEYEAYLDGNEDAVKWVMSLPLASRLSKEEKERVRNMYKELSECIENRTADVEYLKGKRCQLVIIFGADFFKEGE